MSVDTESQPIKMVIVGDAAIGKTSVLQTYLNGTYPVQHDPTVFENHVGCFSDGENDNHISFWDTAGLGDFDKLRPHSYQDTTVFLVCFSVVNRESFANVTSKWLPEIRKFCGLEVPTVLLGTKTDLRTESGALLKHRGKDASYITTEEGLCLARSEKMYAYIESSAILSVGCHSAIKAAVEAARNYELPANKKNCCAIQ